MVFRRSALFAGVAATALLGGAGVAYAATHSANPTASAQTTSQNGTPSASASAGPQPASPDPARRGRFGFPGLIFGGGLGAAIHGQVTVPKAGGGYQTLDVQAGTVSAVSSTSITVKSADGFTASYAVTGSTEVNAESAGIGSVKSGDTVFVSATVSGGSATAADITDITSIKNSRGSFGFPVPAQRAPAGPATGTSA
jgi:acyl dehydratase